MKTTSLREQADNLRMERDRLILKLYRSGEPQAVIARWFGLSRQRVRQVLDARGEDLP